VVEPGPAVLAAWEEQVFYADDGHYPSARGFVRRELIQPVQWFIDRVRGGAISSVSLRISFRFRLITM
jgi:hypothetical protein